MQYRLLFRTAPPRPPLFLAHTRCGATTDYPTFSIIPARVSRYSNPTLFFSRCCLYLFFFDPVCLVHLTDMYLLPSSYFVFPFFCPLESRVAFITRIGCFLWSHVFQVGRLSCTLKNNIPIIATNSKATCLFVALRLSVYIVNYLH